jgi:hypothetical protein
MIQIAIRQAAFDAIMPAGLRGYEAQRTEKGEHRAV